MRFVPPARPRPVRARTLRGAAGRVAQGFPTSSAAISKPSFANYLLKHPEVLEEAMAELAKRQTAAEAERSMPLESPRMRT